VTGKYQQKDTVLDDYGKVAFTGTPAETREWLQALLADYNNFYVRQGYTRGTVTVQEYLNAG
jgi:hypothetical protein